MTLTDQLNRLAELAPGVCRKTINGVYCIGGYQFFVAEDGEFSAVILDIRFTAVGRPAHAWLRDAVEHAIEVRGGYWELRYWKPKREYQAEIAGRRVWDETPTGALLSAFIEALERER